LRWRVARIFRISVEERCASAKRYSVNENGDRIQKLLPVVLLAFGLWPTTARACAVCFSANDANRTAFLLTTLFLSTLPLALIGGFLLWLRRRARQRAALRV